MFCQEGRPLVVTIRVPFVSVVQVDSSHPLEQPLTADDHSSQRTEQEPIPNADDDDRDGVHARPSDYDVSLTYESRSKNRHARSCTRWRKRGTAIELRLAQQMAYCLRAMGVL